MVLAPAVAASLNAGLPARTKGLYIDGLDVLKNTVQGYGVPVESIELVEAAPGQVSSLSFVLEDPNAVLSVADTAVVRYQDISRDLPLFLGFVESMEPVALGIGRAFNITCVGIEIILDWWYAPTVTFSGAAAARTFIQEIMSVCYRNGGVQVNIAASTAAGASTQAAPVASFFGNTSPSPAGTLRQAFQAVCDYAMTSGPNYVISPPQVTVDFFGNLRVAGMNPRTAAVGYDLTGLDISEYVKTLTLPASGTPSNTAASTDFIGAIRAVYVIGSGAGTGLVGDGTGKPGPVAAITDGNSTSADMRYSIGTAYIARNGVTIAGSVTVEETLNVGSVGAELRAGVLLTLVDPNLGTVCTNVQVHTITKTFLPNGKENWRLDFGVNVSGANYMRQLTKSQLV